MNFLEAFLSDGLFEKEPLPQLFLDNPSFIVSHRKLSCSGGQVVKEDVCCESPGCR